MDDHNFVSTKTNYVYDQSFVPVITNSTYEQHFVSKRTNALYGRSFVPVLMDYAYDQQFISTGTNYASDLNFESTYMKTRIILLSYYPLSYQNLHTHSGYFHALSVTHSIPTGTLTRTKYDYVYVTG